MDVLHPKQLKDHRDMSRKSPCDPTDASRKKRKKSPSIRTITLLEVIPRARDVQGPYSLWHVGQK